MNLHKPYPKLFPEKQYEEIIKWIGSAQYEVFQQGDPLPPGVFSIQPQWDVHNFVVAATGTTVSDYYFTYRTANQDMPYSMQSLVVPRNSKIVVARFLRYDQTHGLPHYNADDQIIFPTKKGDIWRLPRKDPCDHYVSIIDNSTVVNIAHAYRLPEQNKGPLESYTVKGASFLIKLSPFQDKGERGQANND